MANSNFLTHEERNNLLETGRLLERQKIHTINAGIGMLGMLGSLVALYAAADNDGGIKFDSAAFACCILFSGLALVGTIQSKRAKIKLENMHPQGFFQPAIPPVPELSAAPSADVEAQNYRALNG